VSARITILLVDDHEMFREGLIRTFEREPQFKIVGQSSNVADAVAQLSKNPDLILLDVDLGPERALDFLKECQKTSFAGKILILTAGISGQEAVQLIEGGAVGILHKHHPSEVLRSTIRKAVTGQSCLEPEYLSSLVRSLDRSRTPARPTFTNRDRLVLKAVLQGLTNREIGQEMNIKEGSVKAAMHVLFQKTGVRTRSQLVKIVLEQYKHEL
jgi:two-component system nitrate/nitrite response regulator NarL